MVSSVQRENQRRLHSRGNARNEERCSGAEPSGWREEEGAKVKVLMDNRSLAVECKPLARAHACMRVCLCVCVCVGNAPGCP